MSNHKAALVHVQFRPEIKKEEVIEAIGKVMGRFGCPACGLRGIDLHIHGGDPGPEGLAGMAGVTGVIVQAQ